MLPLKFICVGIILKIVLGVYNLKLNYFEELVTRIYFQIYQPQLLYKHRGCKLSSRNEVEHRQQYRKKFVIFICMCTCGMSRKAQ